jgi:3-hydroxybutyryl-CoA dehydrogenase
MLDELEIAVVGAGLMGTGIAQVFAAEGAGVRLHDPVREALASAPARIDQIQQALGREDSVTDRIELCAELPPAVAGADWVFEAVPEDLELKRDLFSRLDELAPDHVILATNTSVMRVTAVAAQALRPDRIVGTHWWNPPYLVPLVEVVGGERTAPGTVQRALELLERAGKTPIHVRRDVPGFVGNRLQHALWRQAFALVDAGVCSPADVDTVIRASFGPRLAVLGPMENADLIGLDLTKQIHDYVLPTLDPPSSTSPTLANLVARGELGAKTGSGLGQWTGDKAAAARKRLLDHLSGAATSPTTRGAST